MSHAKNWLMRLLMVAALFWAGRVAWGVKQEMKARELRRPSSYPTYDDLMPAVGLFIAMLFAQLLFRPLFSVIARAMIPKQARWSYAVWGAKVTRCCDAVFKCCYYVTMTVWGYSILRKEQWLPPVLGGHGDTSACWIDNFPFQEVSVELRRFYLTAMGFHLSEAAMIVLETRHPDFWEMLLHHTVACSLVILSYALNYLRVGSLVLLLHGATDIFVYFSKAIVDTPNIRLAVASYFLLLIAYAWFRIVVFPVYILRSAWLESSHSGEEPFGWGFMNFALCVLLLLHMYWFGLIIKIGFFFRRTGQPKDLQSNLSSMDIQDKKRS